MSTPGTPTDETAHAHEAEAIAATTPASNPLPTTEAEQARALDIIRGDAAKDHCQCGGQLAFIKAKKVHIIDVPRHRRADDPPEKVMLGCSFECEKCGMLHARAVEIGDRIGVYTMTMAQFVAEFGIMP